MGHGSGAKQLPVSTKLGLILVAHCIGNLPLVDPTAAFKILAVHGEGIAFPHRLAVASAQLPLQSPLLAITSGGGGDVLGKGPLEVIRLGRRSKPISRRGLHQTASPWDPPEFSKSRHVPSHGAINGSSSDRNEGRVQGTTQLFPACHG
jgi:hypothetical protein